MYFVISLYVLQKNRRVTSCDAITSAEGIVKGCGLKRSMPDLKYADTHRDIFNATKHFA